MEFDEAWTPEERRMRVEARIAEIQKALGIIPIDIPVGNFSFSGKSRELVGNSFILPEEDEN